MTTHSIYYTALVTHIIGITAMAGTTFANYIIFKQFWKQYALDRQKAIAVNSATTGFAAAFGIGFLLLIVSGVTMMYLTHGAFGEQTWFKIKFGLILLIVVNGLVFGRRQLQNLKRNLLSDASDTSEEIATRIRTNLNIFYISQMVIFIIIFTLSAFKFN